MASLLSQVTKGAVKRPHFILLYGPDGVGKSTFAAEAPKPIFLGADDGLATIDAPSLPIAKSWETIKAGVSELIAAEHEYETAVIDTVTGLEVLLWNYIIKEEKVSSIEEVGGGFGKGYVMACEHWSTFLNDLKRLRSRMNVILLGHTLVKTFEDPHNNEKFDRYQLKMNEKSASIIREAVDAVFFANFKTEITKEKGAKKAKAFGDGKRMMYTERRPAFDAKCRFAMPFECDLSWPLFADYAAKSVSDGAAKTDAILDMFKGNEEAAVAYLVHVNWLQPGQPLRDLLAKYRKQVLARPDDFLRAVEKHQQQAQEQPQEEETTAAEDEKA